MAEDALARAREIAARLSGAITGSDLGKRKNRFDDEHAGLGSLKRKKIYIPVNNYPDINFLGLLIGPKGVTQKQMQEATGAKILIRGRGASKDGSTSSTGHPDDNDELHVCIEGSEASVDRASVEIEKILFNPEQAQRLKQEQLRQLSSGGSDSSIYGPGGMSADSSGGYSVELRIPNHLVGLVIGKGGENIVRIQTQLAVHVQIAKESDMKPGETLRSIVIKGPPEGVTEAKKRIDEIVDQHTGGGGGGGSGRANTSSSGGYGKELDHAFVVRLPVPNDKVGIIIGKGGMTIKAIQEKSRATVVIPPQPDEDNPQVRTLSIGADSKEALDTAQIEIFMQLQSAVQNNSSAAYAGSPDAVQLMVPDEKVGIVIGKQGSTIKDMQTRLQVRIIVPQQADHGTNPPMRTVTILGGVQGRETAKYEMEMMLAGTPLANQGGSAYGAYGASGYGAYGQQAAYGAYYGASATAGYGYGSAAGYGAIDPYAAYATTASTTTPTNAVTSTAAAAVPTDPTAYYNDFWQYAAYYGEEMARAYYGAWSPPEGTPAPANVVIPTATATTSTTPAVTAEEKKDTTSTTTTTNNDNTATSEGTNQEGASTESVDPAQQQAAWEAYRKQYAEWYEAHGKASGADPLPPI